MSEETPVKKTTSKRVAPRKNLTVAATQPAEATIKPAKSDAPPMARKSLQQGDRGAAVQWAQERLAALGFEVGRIDGYYSSLTMKAVRQFESSKGLKITGVLTPDRYDLLK